VHLTERNEGALNTESKYEGFNVSLRTLMDVRKETKVCMKELNKIVDICKYFLMDRTSKSIAERFNEDLKKRLKTTTLIEHACKSRFIMLEDNEEVLKLKPMIYRIAKETNNADSTFPQVQF
jgi:hypothetical protein